jgi:glycerophosphoryl diester phosphodiesterase
MEYQLNTSGEFGIVNDLTITKDDWTLCTPERLLKAQKNGLHVSVWTVNEPALMRRLADFGADSIITDFPGLAVQTLKA